MWYSKYWSEYTLGVVKNITHFDVQVYLNKICVELRKCTQKQLIIFLSLMSVNIKTKLEVFLIY